MTIIIVTFLLITGFINVQSAKILGVYPYPGISHQIVFRKLTEELLKHGHQLTVITTDPAYSKEEVPGNLTEIDVHDISYESKNYLLSKSSLVGDADSVYKTKTSKLCIAKIFEAQLNTNEVQNFLKSNEHFDLILIEAMVRPAYVFSHIFNAPTILISSMGVTFNDNNVMGTPSHPILYPIVFNEKLYNITTWEKLKIFYEYLKIEYEDMESQVFENELLQKYFGPNVPTVSDLCNNVDMLLLNMNSIWADNQPLSPNVIYFGGLELKEKKELPQDLLSFLDSSKHGVIYVSFGTNVLSSLIPTQVVEGIIRVLSRLPYDILWKWDQDQLPLNSTNIKISKWFPQSDLLRHKNIKLFITQGGLQSTDEAITAGVPLIAIPLMGDQTFNADKYVRHGIGEKMLVKDFNENVFKNLVDTVLNSESYRQNVAKLRSLIIDQPEPPLARAMWWIEYVIRHKGAKHLRAPAANMPWMQFIEIEVILLVIAIAVLSTVFMIFGIMLCLKILRLMSRAWFKWNQSRMKKLS